MRQDSSNTEQDITSHNQGAATGPLSFASPGQAYPPPGATHPLSPGVRQHRHRPHRMPLAGPFLLIVLGTIFLLNNFGSLDWSVWGQLWRLWPLILIAIGADMLVGKRNPLLSPLIMLCLLATGAAFLFATGGFHSEGKILRKNLSAPLNGAKSARLSVQFSGGDLEIHSLDSSAPNLLGGTLEYAENQGEPFVKTATEGTEASVSINENNLPTYSHSNINWNVRLNPQIPFSLLLITEDAGANLDLEKLNIINMDITLQGNDTNIRFPSNPQSTHATITGKADDLNLLVPEGAEAHIDVSSLKAEDVNVDEHRFVKNGQAYETRGYSQAAHKLTIDLRLNASNVNIQTK